MTFTREILENLWANDGDSGTLSDKKAAHILGRLAKRNIQKWLGGISVMDTDGRALLQVFEAGDRPPES